MSGPANPPVSGPADPPGLRVVLDVRPLQDPGRSPVTARYLDGLLGGFDAAPVYGESFAFLLQSDLEDPTRRFGELDVVGRRLLPPTRLLRSAAMTIDPFLLRGASIGAAWRAERRGATGAVYHAAAGTSPLFAGIPIVVTLLDLAPWELPQVFQRGLAVRFGQRLRTQLLREAAAVIVGTEAVATAARRLLRLRHDRLRVVRLAADPAFAPVAEGALDPESDAERERLGLAGRYLVYSGRYDARQDLGTLLRAIGLLAGKPRPRGLPEDAPWPPRILLVGASPADRASLARASLRAGVSDSLAYAPGLPPARLAALVRSAKAAILPALSDAAGLSGIDAIAAGVPVIASAVGALPEIVGRAGILVEPRDPARLAEALRTVWADERMHRRLAEVALERAADRRTWADVALETRRIYAEVGVAPSRS
ncbi:MAG TPA: glycosyltransferase [Candidatus Eisenbacteria bacterium]|nr:glycosyltransferase [Candidatus Eisenbacteria bacterium]